MIFSLNSNRLFVFYLIFIQTLFFYFTYPCESKEKPHILFISSYHPAFPGFEKQIKGFISVFPSEDITLDIEFMDTKRFPSKENIKIFKNLLSYKFANTTEYDLVVAADDNALLFVLAEKNLFDKTPIVFLGVNNVSLALEQNLNPMVTGVVEAVSMEETISLMLRLKPETGKVIAISDSTASGKYDAATFLKESKKFSGIDFQLLSLVDLTWDELLLSLGKEGEGTAFLLLSAYIDKNHSIKNFAESLEIIDKNTFAPIYHLWFHGIGSGLIGGKVISHYEQGKTAAIIGKQILSGKDISEFRIILKSPNKYLFDYNELNKYNISESQLPGNSNVINLPPSVCKGYKKVFLLIFIIIFSLCLFLIIAIVNISKRKTTEKKLKDSEERYSSLFNNNNYPMLIIKPSTLDIVSANPAAVNFYGWPYEEITQMKISDINILGAEEIIIEISKIVPEKINHYYFQHRLSSGDIRDVEVHSSFITHGKEKIIFSIIHDITDENRLKQEIEKMDRIKSIGTLAGGIAHDFNNILMIIFGNISMAMEYLEKTHEAYPFIRESEKALERAETLTKQLLTFSRGGEPVKENLNIDMIAEDVASFDLSGSNVKPDFTKDKDLWTVDADKGQMQQVFSNLVINADQAMPDGGYIYFSFKNLEIGQGEIQSLDGGCYVVSEIRDKGHGMEPGVMERIFDPYFTTKSSGSGLGLATTYSIISRHKGKIEVESEPGFGSLFRVYLPAGDVNSKGDSDKALKKYFSGSVKPKVLVMDDEEMILKLVGEMLQELNCGHEICKDGDEAVQKYTEAIEKGSPFDLVIMDLTIPGGIGGREAVKKILKIDKNARVVVSSGYTDDEIILNYMSYGFKAVMIKPYRIENLKRVLAGVMG